MSDRAYSSVVLTFVLALEFCLLFGSSAEAARKLAKHVNVTAYLPDDHVCSEQVDIWLVASDKSVFQGEKRTVQRLIGAVRAALGFECTQAKDLKLMGQVSGKIVWKGIVSAKNGWVLVDLGDTSPASPNKPQEVSQTPGTGNGIGSTNSSTNGVHRKRGAMADEMLVSTSMTDDMDIFAPATKSGLAILP